MWNSGCVTEIARTLSLITAGTLLPVFIIGSCCVVQEVFGLEIVELVSLNLSGRPTYTNVLEN